MGALVVLVLYGVFFKKTSTHTTYKKIYISQVVEHPALHATVKGIIEELAIQGFESGKSAEIVIDSAQGQIGIASQIAAKFVAQDPTVVVGVGTLSAQSFLKYSKNNNIPLVFSSVTDPMSAKLLDEQGKNSSPVYGVSNFVPLEPQLELFLEIQPDLKKLGILYNPAELNSVSIVQKLEKSCQTYGIQLITQTLTTTADAMQAANQLASTVDAIFISNDNSALSALPTIIAATDKAKIPTYVSDTDAIQLGALAALGPNQYKLGRQTGIMIAKLLRNESIHIQLEYPAEIECYLNMQTARKLGITLPHKRMKTAASIIGVQE